MDVAACCVTELSASGSLFGLLKLRFSSLQHSHLVQVTIVLATHFSGETHVPLTKRRRQCEEGGEQKGLVYAAVSMMLPSAE
jgi:hypothetical protein